MSNNFTGPLTVNGTKNLLSLMVTAGYAGSGKVSYLHVLNPSTSVTAYVHFTSDGATGSVTGTNGLPVLTAGAAYPTGVLAVEAPIDLATTIIHTASSISVTIAVIGG